MTTERWLLEKLGYELVIIHLEDVLLLEGPLSTALAPGKGSGQIMIFTLQFRHCEQHLSTPTGKAY